jgi:hypothetical protein
MSSTTLFVVFMRTSFTYFPSGNSGKRVPAVAGMVSPPRRRGLPTVFPCLWATLEAFVKCVGLTLQVSFCFKILAHFFGVGRQSRPILFHQSNSL